MDSKLRRQSEGIPALSKKWLLGASLVLICGWVTAPLLRPSALLWAENLRDSGVWGLLLFCAVFLACSLLLLPASLLNVAAGFAFGYGQGFVFSLTAATVAAVLTFVIVRHLLRPWVTPQLSRWPNFEAVSSATAEQGFQLVLLLRLSPIIPFALLNHLAALSQMRLRDFVLGSLVGKSPTLLLQVHLGVVLAGMANPAPSLLEQLLLWIGLAATALATWLVTRAAKRRALLLLEQEKGPS